MIDHIYAAGGTSADAEDHDPSLRGRGLEPPGTDAGRAATGLPANPEGGQRPVTVLVVDDSRVFRRGMVRAIEACSDLRLVGEAADGREGLEAIARLRPDVVLLDLRMPNLDGIEVLERLRDSGAGEGISVLLVSATLDEGVGHAALAAGAAACVSKAISRADICDAVVQVARR